MLVIFGANGFLGKQVVKAASESGYKVKAICRKQTSYISNELIEWIVVDFQSSQSIMSVINSGDKVLNFIFSSDEVENFYIIDSITKACLTKNASCFLHCSTAVLVGKCKDIVITEETQCFPSNKYEKIKFELEQRVILASKKGLKSIIVRPTAIFGPGGLNLIKLTNSLLKQSQILNYLRLCIFGDRPMHLVPVQKVVAAIIHLINISKLTGVDIYIVASDEDSYNNYGSIERLLFSSLNLQSRLIPPFLLPRIFLRIILKLRGRSESNDRYYSSKKLNETGFSTNITLSESIQSFGKWYLKNIY